MDQIALELQNSRKKMSLENKQMLKVQAYR